MRKPTIYLTLIILIICSCTRPLTQVFENYETNANRLDSLASYFHKIKPDSIDLWIRFENKKTFDIVLWDKRTIKVGNGIFDEYGFFKKYGNLRSDSIAQKVLNFISISINQLDSVESYLNEVSCNSIGYKCEYWDIRNGGGFVEIGFPTHDLYGLDYILMDSKKDSIFLNYVGGKCNYKVINNRTLIRYVGPAFGSDCFPDKK